MERLKALRAELVSRYQIQPGVLCPNWLLESVAREAPASLEELGKIDRIRKWQIREFGEQLLQILHRKPGTPKP
jgi:ribonuclease D